MDFKWMIVGKEVEVTDSYLDWEVVGPETKMISATQWGELRAHVHFQMLEEVMVLRKRTEAFNNGQRKNSLSCIFVHESLGFYLV